MILARAGLAAAQDASTQVPIGYWGYELLARLEARGVLSRTGDGIRPLSRHRLAELALQAQRSSGLTVVDAARVRQLLADLDPEVARIDPSRRPAIRGGSRRSAWRQLAGNEAPAVYHTSRGTIYADLLAREQIDILNGRGRDASEVIYRHRLGGVVRGDMGGHLGVHIAFEQTREEGTRKYRFREDVYERRLEAVQLKGGLADYHEGAAYVTFAFGHYVDVQLGKDRLDWGPAASDNLALTSNAPAFDMVRLRSRFGALQLVSVHGALRPCPNRVDAPVCAGTIDADTLKRPWLWPGADTDDSYVVNGQSRVLDRQRWIAAHRLEVALSPTLDVGFEELVVYGDRGPEWAYLNPFTFYWAAQSYLGDRDNVMIALDVDWRLRPGVRWWGAYAVDDLRKLKVFTNDFANKFSVQTGLDWFDPLGLKDTDVHADYVRIEPWISTHRFPVNSLRHFDAPLGHSLGPNSDRWRLRILRRWRPRVATGVELSRTRHGDNVLLPGGKVRNVGGDLHWSWRPGDDRDTKEFLAGNRGERTRIGTDLDLQPWPRLRLRATASLEWGDNVPLPPQDGPATPLNHRTGYGDGLQSQLSLDLRYGIF